MASVILGARNEDQFRQNLGAVGWNLTRVQAAKLDVASEFPSAYRIGTRSRAPIGTVRRFKSQNLKGFWNFKLTKLC